MKIKVYKVDVVNLTGTLMTLKEAGVSSLMAQDKGNDRYILLEDTEETKFVVNSIKELSYAETVSFDLLTGEVATIELATDVAADNIQTIEEEVVEVTEETTEEVSTAEATQHDPNLENLLYEVEKAFSEQLDLLEDLFDSERLELLPEAERFPVQNELFRFFKTFSAIQLGREELIRSVTLDVVDRGAVEGYNARQAVLDVKEALSDNFADYPAIVELNDKVMNLISQTIDDQLAYDDEDEALPQSDVGSLGVSLEDQLAAFYKTIVKADDDEQAQETEDEEVKRESYVDENGVSMTRPATKKEGKPSEEFEGSDVTTEEVGEPTVDDEGLSEVELLRRRLAELEGTGGQDDEKADKKPNKKVKSKKPKKKLPPVVYGAGLGLILLAAAGGFIWLTSGNNTDDTAAPQTPSSSLVETSVSTSSSIEVASSSSTTAASTKTETGSTASNSSSVVQEEETEAEDYLLTKEEHMDYMKRLDNIGTGIYINNDGTLGGELRFSDNTTKRIAEFNRNGELVMEDGTRYELAKVQGLLKRVESGGGN